MTKEAYPGLFHFIHKRMKDVEFPTSKQSILLIAGNRPVHVDWEQTVLLRTFVEKIGLEDFSSAAEFYCALIASL